MIFIRRLKIEDKTSWERLFNKYREFYGKIPSSEILETVWSWLFDSEQDLNGLVAEVEGEIVGFAHYRSFPRPIDGKYAVYLDDLYTVIGYRNRGVATELIRQLHAIAQFDDLTLIRWVTASSNEVAQKLYDRLSTRTEWITYELKVEQ